MAVQAGQPRSAQVQLEWRGEGPRRRLLSRTRGWKRPEMAMVFISAFSIQYWDG